MKRLALLLAFSGIISTAFSQNEPHVQWKYSCKKVKDSTYAIHMIATIDEGWNIYTQSQPEKHKGTPTLFRFYDNGDLNQSHTVKEVGTLNRLYDSTRKGGDFKYYGTVDFYKYVTLINKKKSTTLIGEVQYQAANGKERMMPRTEKFSILIK